jgi:hypothetical protein
MTFLRLVTSHVQSLRRKQSNIASKTVQIKKSITCLHISPQAREQKLNQLTHSPAYINPQSNIHHQKRKKPNKKETKASYTPSKDVSTTELIIPIQGCGLTYPEGFEPSTFA